MDRQLIENEIKHIQGLKQNQSLPIEELEKKAIINIHVRDFEHKYSFVNEEDLKDAKKLFDFYLSNYQFDNPADISILEDLVLNEIRKLKTDKAIETFYQKSKDGDMITKTPSALFDTRRQLEEDILNLKLKLGLSKDKEEQDDLTGLQILMKKMDDYILAHKEEFTTICGNCGTPLLLRRRVKDFDSMKHPWFAGRWLFNYEILKDVKDGKLSKEQAARYMYTAAKGGDINIIHQHNYSVAYIEYCLKNWDEIVSYLSNKERT